MREMKDSGIEWIKEIPVSWNVLRGKNILNIHKRAYSDNCEVVTCFRDGQVTLRSNRREEGFTFADKEIGYQGVKTGDLVIHGMDGFAGAIGISDSDGKASPVLNVCTPQQNYNTKFLMYYLRMLATQNVFIALATGIRERSCDLRWNKIAELLFPITTEIEQTTIANYLDNKCGKIDVTIQREKQHIEKLKEYRQSVITEAVTKGLDPTVPMKDSGIEWIGEVPQGWKVCTLNKLARIMTGNTPSKNDENEFYSTENGVMWIKPENLNAFNGVSVPKEYVNEKGLKYARVVEPNTVLVCCIGTIGKFGFSSERVAFNQQINAVLFDDKVIHWKYGMYYISSQEKQHHFHATGNVVQIINTNKQGQIYFCVPPLPEQTTIADYLDRKTAQIDSAIAKKEMLIERLTEYKKSLIYEAVTGKVEVS